MDVTFKDSDGNTLTCLEDILTSWLIDNDEYSSGDTVTGFIDITNTSGQDIQNFMISVHPDISIWNFNDLDADMSDAKLQAYVINYNNILDVYREITFSKTTEVIDAIGDYRAKITVSHDEMIDTLVPGLRIYIYDGIVAGDDFGFKISDGHLYMSLSKDELEYLKTLEYTSLLDGETVRVYFKIEIPSDWDSHCNPMNIRIDAYNDGMSAGNSLRYSLTNIYSRVLIPVKASVLTLSGDSLPFEFGG